MATWSVAGGFVTLTLDGSESGVIRRRDDLVGLDPNELYTFYLTVNPSTTAVQAYLEVVGGDLKIATIAGVQTLVARGMTDGSGNISVRFGVQNAQGGGGVSYSENLDYASIGAFEATGWTKVQTGGITLTSSIDSVVVDSGTTSLKLHMNSPGWIAGNGYYEKTVPGLAPNTPYRMKLRTKHQDKPWFLNPVFTCGSGSNFTRSIEYGAADPDGFADILTEDDSSHGFSDGSGNLVLRIGMGGDTFGNIQWTAWYDGTIEITALAGGGATITFDTLTRCKGTGVSETGGTGNGPSTPPNDPPPTPPPGGYPPPPSGGDRPFGAFSISPAGFGYWNNTIKIMTRSSTSSSSFWAANLIKQARDAGCTIWLCGNHKLWYRNGVFNYDAWNADITAVYNHASSNAAIAAGIADGTAFGHYVIDEPFWYGRWGYRIPITTVERMCMRSKELWPTWRTAIRASALDVAKYINRHVVGLDDLWAQYVTRKGDIVEFRDKNIAKAQELNHGLVIGLNIADFLGTSTRNITPAELLSYGKVLAASSFTTAFVCWQYEASLYTSAFETANRELRDYYASFDPP